MKIRILLADNNQLFRELLTERFSKTTDMEVVAEAENGDEVLDKVGLVQPDMILLEVAIPGINAAELTKTILKSYPNTKVVALTSLIDKQIIKGMLEANAWGYLLKKCTFEQLALSILQVASNKKHVSTDIQPILIEEYLDRNGLNGISNLTKRELDVLKLFAEGKTIKDISETFFISVKTVGTHKQNIFEKMGFENLSQLIRYALNHGIVS
jgi:two-component system, NarL family, response regulator NreC